MAKWKQKWEVPRSQGEGVWVVSQAEDGNWGCSCPRWKFKREHCHHIVAVQQNADAYAKDRPTPLPEIVPGNVEECEVVEGYCLHPLIPLDGRGTGVLATIVYDLLKMGYSFGQIKSRFSMVPREWTAQAVLGYVESRGRTLCPTSVGEGYRVMPVKAESEVRA